MALLLHLTRTAEADMPLTMKTALALAFGFAALLAVCWASEKVGEWLEERSGVGHTLKGNL